MKVTLLALGSRYIHLSPAPFYLASALLEGEHTVTVLDHSVNEKTEIVLEDILKSAPDILGFSVYIWNLTYLKKLIPSVKEKLPSVRIVLGGPEVSYNVKETLERFPEAEAVLSGEGEVPFRAYCDAVANGHALSTVPGCSYRTANGISVGEPYLGEGTPRSPLDSGYREALKGRIAYIEASRGCPFSCAFCLSGRCGNVRFFDIEQVKRDILLLSAESRTVKFVDRTFNADKRRAREIISFILAHSGREIPEDTCFHFEIAGELLDEETLKLLADAPRGLFQTEIGLQSFHQPTLAAIRRSANTDQLCKNIRSILKNGNVHVHIDLIAGLPYEDLSAFKNSFECAYALAPHMLQLGFLKLLHGAPLREETEKFQCCFAAEPPYEVSSTDCLSQEDLALLHVVELGCDRVYNSGRYRRTLALWREKTSATVSAFQLFHTLGICLSALPKGYTVNDEITALYHAFLKMGMDGDVLRDAMLLDFIATNSSRLVPTALRREDPFYGRIKKTLEERYPLPKGIRRAVVLLSAERRVAFADYTVKDRVTGEYPLTEMELSAFKSALSL